jgi:quercetin dioxygenase-like cupin family protein
MPLKAGDVRFVPAGTKHAAKECLRTYVAEKGKPLVELAKGDAHAENGG